MYVNFNNVTVTPIDYTIAAGMSRIRIRVTVTGASGTEVSELSPKGGAAFAETVLHTICSCQINSPHSPRRSSRRKILKFQ